MWKFPRLSAALAVVFALSAGQAEAGGDPAKGERVYKKCKACHAIGEGAKNRVGPQLNAVVGRAAGSIPGYRYSKAMREAGDAGLVWTTEALDDYLAAPKAFLKGTKMAFPGLKKATDRENLIAYLHAAAADGKPGTAATAATTTTQVAAAAATGGGAAAARPSHGVFHLGRMATPAEIAAWDIDIRPDGAGLPDGKGTVADGEVVYEELCAACHGDFGEGRDRWPVLAGGFDTLTADRPVKTIGSYWPYLLTVYDYVRRAMPFGDARSLSDDEVYAVTAYLLYLNDIVTEEDFELSRQNFTAMRLGNEANFVADDRAAEEHYRNGEPCMRDCKPGPVEVLMRARVLDVTPDSDADTSGAAVD